MTTLSAQHLPAQPRDRIAGLLTPAQLTAVVLLLVGVVAVFWQWFERQHRHSMGAPSDWGHAYVIPLISAYLVWRDREAITRTRTSTFWPGLLPVLLGIGSYFVAVVVVKNHMIQGLSMVLTIAGLALLLTGPRMFGRLFLPILYLVFAITISEMIMIKITFQLQLIASQGAGVLLALIGPLMGFTVDVDGNTLYITPTGKEPLPLNVAEACSGMRMVIAFFALAGAVALISSKFWWQRVAVLVLALPVAVFMNIVRVAILGIASKYSPELTKGDAHVMIGTLLLLPGLMLFLGIVWALGRVVDEPAATKPAAAPTPSVPGASPNRGKVVDGWSLLRTPAFIAAMCVMTLSGASMTAGIKYAGIHLKKLAIYPPGDRQVATVSTDTPSWRQIGADKLESAEVLETLGTSNYVSRQYLKKSSEKSERPIVIDFHAAYYTGMVDTVPHVPERCFVGGGMQIGNATKTVGLTLDSSGWSPANVENASERGLYRQRVPNYAREGVGTSVILPREPGKMQLRITEFANKSGKKLFAGYFFIANGGHVSSAEEVRLLAFDLKSDYAYYLKVQFTSSTVNSAEELAQEASSLLGELLPEIMRCVPDWVEVEAGRYPANNAIGGGGESGGKS
ncbi:MAG: exosortase [Phycisphaerales bacterium]|nr:exosortase [Phycisphaerales bacterium]